VISGWLTRQYQDRGTYRLSGESISFSVNSRYSADAVGTIDYVGYLRGSTMTLSWRSNINGAIRNAVPYAQLGCAASASA
jgi:hypothetical protein